MRRTLWFNDTHPDEQNFTNETESRVEELLERFRDTSTRGVRRGFRVTVNGLDATHIDIGAGQGYTPLGERIELREPINDVSLNISTSVTLATESSPIGIRAGGSYTDGARNYVVLRYFERLGHPLVERLLPIQHDSIALGTFEIEILSEANFEALTSNETIDVSAVPFPTTAPFPSRQFRLLLAIVTAQGASIALTQADIQSVDPGVTQPVDLTGVRILNVSANTPPGTGFLRLRIAEDSKSLAWQAPSDSSEGTAVTAPDPTGLIVLSSLTSTYQIVLDITHASLPEVEVREAIGIVTRLALTFPQPTTQPTVVTGVVIRSLSTNTPIGEGTLSFNTATNLATWAAAGDGTGAGVDISGGGTFILRSGSVALFASIFVSETQLPSGINPATGTTVWSDLVDVRGLYDLLIPIETADDILHRSYVGSGTPTPRNPHGLSFGDVAESSGDNPFETHQDLFHKNGISGDANPDFLKCSATITAGGDDAIQVQPPLSEKDVYLIDGIAFNTILPDPPLVVFDDLTPTGYYLVYVDADGILTTIRAALVPDLTGVTTVETLPTVPHLRILDIKNSLAPNDGSVAGTLRYTPTTQMFRWRAPGDDSLGEAGFGVVQEAKADMRLASANGDILRIALDLTELVITGSTINVPITVLLDANVVNEENSLPLCMVLWDVGSEQFVTDFDLRCFATADNEPRVRAIELEVHEARGTSPTLFHRIKDDRNRLLDNGISTHHEHDSAVDLDPTALLVEVASPNSLVTCLQPSAPTTFIYVNGREFTTVVDNSDPANDPPDFDYAIDTNDDDTGPETVASLHQLNIDEFGRLRNHVRVREPDDAQTKAIRGYVISNVSDDFPAGTATLAVEIDTPSTGFHTFTLTVGSAGVSVVTDELQDGETWRLYAGDATSWVEITRIGTILAPGADATETFEAFTPLDENAFLEVARIAYDGSSEIIRVIDKRRFGTVGRRSLGSDALDFSKRIHDEYHSETRSDGVVRGFDLSFSGAVVTWTGGVADVAGNRYDVVDGSLTNTVANLGNRRRYLMVNESGEMVLSAADVRRTSVGRRFALVGIIYIQATTTNIEYVEDRRSFPSVLSTLTNRRYLDEAQILNIFHRSGVDPAHPFSSDLDGTSGIWWNCHRTAAGPGGQGAFWWLDDEEKDGLFMVMTTSLVVTSVPELSGYSDPSAFGESNFLFFRITAGDNPRDASALTFLGIGGGIPIETQVGNMTSGTTVTFPTRIMRYHQADFQPSNLGSGRALVELKALDSQGEGNIGWTEGDVVSDGSGNPSTEIMEISSFSTNPFKQKPEYIIAVSSVIRVTSNDPSASAELRLKYRHGGSSITNLLDEAETARPCRQNFVDSTGGSGTNYSPTLCMGGVNLINDPDQTHRFYLEATSPPEANASVEFIGHLNFFILVHGRGVTT